MERYELEGLIDENHRLSVQVPPHFQAGKVKVILQKDDTESDDDWSRWVAHIWSRDWSDPREDIYTLEDGTPIDEQGRD
jgi:hypothetical protein